MEEWRDIKGWKGIYQVSNHGRLKSFKREPNGKILSNVNKNRDYFRVTLCGEGRLNRSTRMHVLVAEAFIPNSAGKPEINHKDGNKQNNHIENLEWVTRFENSHHAIQNGMADFKGMNRYNQYIKPRPVLQVTLGGKVVCKYHNCVEAGRKTGICSRNIHQVASKTEYKPGLTRVQAGGYVWRFYGD